MKDIRIISLLSLPEYDQEEYRLHFSHADGINKQLGIFKARQIETMRIDDIIEMRTLLMDGKEFKAMALFFTTQFSIPYPSFKVTKNPSETTQGEERWFFLVKNHLVFQLALPKWFILWSRVTDYFLAVNYLAKELKKLSDIEAERWNHFVSDERKKANKGRFDQFGQITLLRSLAQKEGVSIEDIMKWTWGRVNIEMQISAQESWAEKAYLKFMKAKNKNGTNY